VEYNPISTKFYTLNLSVAVMTKILRKLKFSNPRRHIGNYRNSAADNPICKKLSKQTQNPTRITVNKQKMLNIKNSRWWTAAILKIVIRSVGQRRKFTKTQNAKFLNSRWRRTQI